MTFGATIFMVLSWGFVLGLTFWSFAKILHHQKHFDPDGIGPSAPKEPGRFDDSGKRRKGGR